MKNSAAELVLKAPLSGPAVALETVPDPVFAQKMVGDGISIDPVNEQLIAPCDGEVIQLHRAAHAVTIKAEHGIEVMMHIGLDTVGLNGTGFNAQVKVGDQVKSGQVLIHFDADFVATKARSLLTQIVITNSDQVTKFSPASGFVQAGKDTILTLTPAATSEQSTQSSAAPITSEDIIVPNPTGLHARPTAVLVGEAKQYSSTIHLYKGTHQGNAKSVISIMGMEVNCGDIINIVATGDDAQAAIDALTPLIRGGLGEDCPPISAASAAASAADSKESHTKEEEAPRSSDPNILLGVTASPGFAIGNIVQLKKQEIDVHEQGESPEQERSKLDSAIKDAFAQLDALQASMEDKEKAEIFSAHQALLKDPELLDNTQSLINDSKSAAYAWKTAYEEQAQQLSQLKNQLFAARANDLLDVGRRVLQLILGLKTDDQVLPDNCILIAEDLTPSDTANLDKDKVLGFCTQFGGSSSHVAILARSMNIPAIAGIEGRALQLENGQRVILNASEAELRLNPSDEEINALQQAKQALEEKQRRNLENASQTANTKDGHRIEVVANIAGLEDTVKALKIGGEGVGLLRSEFLFMDRATAPDEEEQFTTYCDIAKALGKDKPLIIRTLDVGGDKPLTYLPIAAEENPFLGLRGIRVMLEKTDIFRIQLRAILRASALADIAKIHIMFPMVTTMEDLRSARALLEEEREKLGVPAIPVGIMVEVPTTAVMADQFAKEVDFFSIGTNDLTQYTLAIDRGHPILAAQADGLNPAVLQLIANTVKGAHKHNKWVGVCGGIASDELATPILVGLGVDELSVSVPSIPDIKAQVRQLTLPKCQSVAAAALEQSTADEVRALVKEMLQ